MIQTFSSVLITLCILPFVPFILTYIFEKILKKTSQQSFYQAINVTMPFLFVAVAALYNTVFNSTIGFYVWLLILLLLLGILGALQNRKRGQVQLSRLLKGFWRISFLLLVPCYVLFGIIGFISYLINS
ncbi:DUF3397 domain-containing protein [Saccharibacillus sp. JS10]|uniref:DUF3397 domain-containing protein n=1 Tax=Saccharibacillus sp. JS10 TaxID=2950552 RepID=UPI002108B47B|nr:DUF3397 domain-containing protein [Saccharibacillus sp. JS10]MCQ4086119.1 DUF3397 domain-containing protein [Saccharibacillus sp. JS10]